MTDHVAREEVTRILVSLCDGQEDRVTAVNRLFEVAYAELLRIAAGTMRDERVDRTMSPGELVSETYLRLVVDSRIHWEGRAHFFGIVASAMREILVEQARRNTSAKRGGGWLQVVLDDRICAPGGSLLDVLELDEALLRFRSVSPRKERVVELRVFAGMDVKEIAHVLGVSERTVHKDWGAARKWLARELSAGYVTNSVDHPTATSHPPQR